MYIAVYRAFARDAERVLGKRGFVWLIRGCGLLVAAFALMVLYVIVSASVNAPP